MVPAWLGALSLVSLWLAFVCAGMILMMQIGMAGVFCNRLFDELVAHEGCPRHCRRAGAERLGEIRKHDAVSYVLFVLDPGHLSDARLFA